jgi:hypothetical protein
MDTEAFEKDLKRMGINPANIGRPQATLPPIPASDSLSLERNTYSSFYQRGAREFWGANEVTAHPVTEFQKCQHYLVRRNNEVQCTKCHVGWLVPPEWNTQDGKLFDGETQLQFAL